MIKNNLLSMISDEQFALLDFKDWILVNDGETDDLKKWIKYRAGNYPDPDEVLKINDDKGCILAELGWYKPNVSKGQQYIDCIFSMVTLFNSFLRFYVANKISGKGKKYYAKLLENYDDIFSENSKKDFCKVNNIAWDIIEKLFTQINRLARNTHTIGNYMPCPYNKDNEPDNEYNRLKGYRQGYIYFKDRLELLYLELQDPKHSEYLSDRRDPWKKWFDEKKEKLLLEEILGNKELLKFRFNGRKMKEGDIISYKNYLKCVNDIIINRGNNLTKQLKTVKKCF